MIWELLSFDKIFVLIVILFILVSLYSGLMGTGLTFLIAVISLGLAGILTPSEMLDGFANEQIMVIIILLLIGDVIRKTGIIESIFDRLFHAAKSYKGFLSRMMLIVGTFSAFLNNTPIVILMMPYVNHWCKKNNISPSKFLIPLSYAAILGGCATLIGTSTNLIVNGMLGEQTILDDATLLKFDMIDSPGEIPSLGIFAFAWVGVPMIIIGFLYILFFGEKSLPSNDPITTNLSIDTPKYVFETHIRRGSHLIGSTIKDSDLDNIKGLFLFEIIKAGVKIDGITPEMVLSEGDILFFTGDTESIAELIDPKSGLTFSEVGTFYKKQHTEVVEVVISQNSTLIRKTVEEINFRAKYDATILAIHRNGEKIEGKIGKVRLLAGDAILLLARAGMIKRTSPQEFYFISKVKDIRKLQGYKIAILFGGITAAILFSALGFISFFKALALLMAAILLFRIVNPKELAKSIDYNLALTIALALALEVAMRNTGVASMIAHGVISVFQPLGAVGLLAGIYLITAIMAAYITNVPAVAIIFPISITTAFELGLNPLPFVLVVAFAAAANFMTPVGYQTNLIVYGPGKYSFNDFLRIGAPLTVLYMTVTVTILSLIYF